ncbi:flagellar protein FlgN [Bacillus sp. 2205SS5-2]|uniref:flagellar protein FlgN n=1 Tax=Bacillus sp. 2205SS5-2 TaxID=3109031 RepID=UPI00300598A0
MSLTPLLTSLTILTKLHQRMFDLSVKKTDIVTEGNIDKLNELLKDEQQHMAAIQTVEKQRQQAALSFLLDKKGASANDAPTINDCLEYADEYETEQLQKAQNQLLRQIVELQERNELNQKLIYQSLQFVNLNLSMMQPENQTATYSRPNQPKPKAPSRSMFDSQA